MQILLRPSETASVGLGGPESRRRAISPRSVSPQMRSILDSDEIGEIYSCVLVRPGRTPDEHAKRPGVRGTPGRRLVAGELSVDQELVTVKVAPGVTTLWL
ncbi:hypothetical protein GCM10023107_15880 [Actinoplanes octamycinicus]|nr:hypothetical protein Aoc01nite_19790 [Actinoplanes octamycinicus]